MSQKHSILLFIKYYLPGYKAGGPVQTIANMVNAIGDRYLFYLVTSDRDVGDETPYSGISHKTWTNMGNAFIRYLAPNEQNFSSYKSIIHETRFDLVYCQSFFDPLFTIIPLFALALSSKRNIPVLLAPRGEFAKGALAHKAFKKQIYSFLFKAVSIHLLHYSFQCSSKDEKNNLTDRLGKKLKVFTALDFNSQEHVDAQFADSQPQNALRLVLLARIDIQKNIDYAIRLLGRIKIPITFDIFGNSFDEHYAQECLNLANQMPEHVHVSFKGSLPHFLVLQTLQKYDLFFMPTKNENFGHVIHEALLAGLPILISDRTPWHELESRKAGWEIPLDEPDRFIKVLEQFSSFTSEQRVQMRHAALQYGIDVSNDQHTLQDNIHMFESLLQA